MVIMTGEIGKLSVEGRQIGGFKYWTAIVYPDKTIVNAPLYWFFEQPPRKLIADFYSDETLIYSKEVEIEPPDCALNKKINGTLTMSLGEFNWLKPSQTK